jgi:hypothetical protein
MHKYRIITIKKNNTRVKLLANTMNIKFLELNFFSLLIVN